VGDHQHDVAVAQVGDHGVVPVGQHPVDDVGQALGGRDDLGGQGAVALVVVGVVRVVVGDGRGRGVVAAAPHLHLDVAEPGGGRRLVEPGEVPVAAFVEPPVPAHRDPRSAHRLQREGGGHHRPGEHRRVQDRGRQATASARPWSDSGQSYQPVKRLSWFHVLCPCRRRIRVATFATYELATCGVRSRTSSGRRRA
jgi:hypothetical protein